MKKLIHLLPAFLLLAFLTLGMRAPVIAGSQAPPAVSGATSLHALSGPLPLLAQTEGFSFEREPVDSGGISQSAKILIIAGVVLFVLFVHALLGLFAALDARKKAMGGWWAWGLFVAFPFFGILGLFIYLFVSMSAGQRNKDLEREKLKQLVERERQRSREEGKEAAMTAAKGEIDKLREELERIRTSVPDMPTMDEEEVTQIIQRSSGHSGIMLIHMGGDRDGHPEALDVRHHLTGDAKKVVIGKNADNAEIALPWDETVSRRHCEVSFEKHGGHESHYVYDLNSSNGTYIRRGEEPFRRVHGKAVIEDGDVLRVGRSQFRVVIFTPVKTESLDVDDQPISNFTGDGKAS